MGIIYEDTQVICHEDSLEIKRYYFPVGTNKKFKYSEIKSFQEEDLTLWNGKGRLWGMNLTPFWFNWDNNRFWKKKMISMNIGQSVNPAITPDHNDTVMEILKSKVKVKG